MKAKKKLPPITLTLSADEAAALLLVCMNIGGLSDTTPRGVFDKIKSDIRGRYYHELDARVDKLSLKINPDHRSIYFE